MDFNELQEALPTPTPPKPKEPTITISPSVFVNDPLIESYVRGLEGKALKYVIQQWLYFNDVKMMQAAAIEMRRRFRKTYPRPSLER